MKTVVCSKGQIVLAADLGIAGKGISVKDSLIAASALSHGLRLVIRNVSDFQKAGVRICNPFE